MSSAQAGFKSGKAGATAADLLHQLGPTLLVDIGLKSRSAPGEPRSLKLPVTDEGEISGVGGKHHAFIYMARIYIPKLDRMLFQPFTGVKLQQGEQWRRVILGRSFLRPYQLIYSGVTGQVEIRDED